MPATVWPRRDDRQECAIYGGVGTAERQLDRIRPRTEPSAAETGRVTGDDRAAQALAALPTDEWTIFRAPHLPRGGCPGVDHVLVGPSGVFVVDSDRWTGAVQCGVTCSGDAAGSATGCWVVRWTPPRPSRTCWTSAGDTW